MTRYLLPLILLLAPAALAHEGVKNAAVLHRMEGMKTIAKDTKLLNQMAKGGVPFARAKAEMAAERLLQEAQAVIPNFEAPEQDPKSEAAATIWTSFPDFAQRAQRLTEAAGGLDTASAATLAQTIGAVNAQCKGCHESYQVPK